MKLTYPIKRLACQLSAKVWRGLGNDSLTIFNWHQVTPVFDPLAHHTHIWTGLEHFQKELTRLASLYPILPLPEAIDRLKKGRLTGPCAALTFDDGDVSMSTYVAPLLKELKLPATFFINTAYLNEHASYWFPISHYLSTVRNAEAAAVYSQELAAKVQQLRLTRDAEFYQKTRREIEALGRFVPDLKSRLVSPEWLASLDGEQFTIGAHGHEHQRYALMPPDWQRHDLRQNLNILSQFKAFKPLFAAPFGREWDWSEETFKIVRDLRLDFILASGGINLVSNLFYRRIVGDGARKLQVEVGREIIRLAQSRFIAAALPGKKLNGCNICHLLTGSPSQLGGVASVVVDLLKLEETSPDFNMSAVWVNNGALKRQIFARFKTRLVGKINRTLSLDAANRPYRFPSMNHMWSRPLAFHGNTVLHVHKASLWQQAARWKRKDPKIALVFHAHSVEGFTGGCILESDCPMLPKQCAVCPIIPSYARGLPRLGFRHRARLLQSALPLIIANSQATYRAITASGMIPDACRVEIVTPGTDPKVFFRNPAADRVRRSQAEGLKIGFVSYSIENPNKGFDDFVKTVQRLKKDFKVGGYAAGEVRPETIQRFPDIQFKGPIHDDNQLREFYQSVDYLVVASRSESFGLISIESQFCGTPVVSYAVGGLPETILDGVTGLVVQPRSPEVLAEGICRLQRQGVLLTQNPEAAQIREFLKKFETGRINTKLAGLYASLFPTMTGGHED